MWISKKKLEKLISDKIEQSKEKRPKFIISSTDGKSYTCTYETRGLFKKYSVPIEVFDESKIPVPEGKTQTTVVDGKEKSVKACTKCIKKAKQD